MPLSRKSKRLLAVTTGVPLVLLLCISPQIALGLELSGQMKQALALEQGEKVRYTFSKGHLYATKLSKRQGDVIVIGGDINGQLFVNTIEPWQTFPVSLRLVFFGC